MSQVKTEVSQQRDTSLLDAFSDAVRDSNPFAVTRVSEPSCYDVDVAAIHAAAFDRLTDLADRAKRQRRGIGAVLLGGAGVGKSHLLSRLYRWAGESVEGDRTRACYVFLHNLLADPDRLPRYLLKCIIGILTRGGRGPLHKSPLFQLVDHAVWQSLKEDGISSPSMKQAGVAYRARYDHPAISRDAYEVLFQFFRCAYPTEPANPGRLSLASTALAWLSGEEIDADAARLLGLKVHGSEPVMLRDDQEVEQVLLALAHLAFIRGQPFILCIDQVDNLDSEKVKALSKFLHALLDHAANLLIIVSGVQQTLLDYRKDKIIEEAAWDRIAEYQVKLYRVRRDEARKIMEARLLQFLEPFEHLEHIKRHIQEDTLFPLGRKWFDQRLGEAIDLRTREVLMWARNAWEEEQASLERLGGQTWIENWPNGATPPPPPPLPPLEVTIDTAVDRKIEEQIAQRRLQPGSLPPDAGNLSGLVEALLGQCRGKDSTYTFRSVERLEKAGRLPRFDLLVRERRDDGQEITTGVLFVTNTGKSATDALRRLLQADPPPNHRLLVTDDERRPLHTGTTGQEYYRNLTELGPDRFEHIKLDFEQYAGLDALNGVVGLARVGDLEIEWPRGAIRPVTEREVIASHHRQNRYRTHPLLRPLLTEEPLPPNGDNGPGPKLVEPDVRQHIMAQLAWRLGMSAYEVTTTYLKAKANIKISPEEAMIQVKAIASRMHSEELIHVTPNDNDLFLQRRK